MATLITSDAHRTDLAVHELPLDDDRRDIDGDAAADVEAELLDDADVPNSATEPASGVTGSVS